jgi:hypothetical protein
MNGVIVMSENTHLAFFILVPEPGSNSVSRSTGAGFTLSLATVDSIDAAVQLVRDLSSQGVTAIELSSSFGDEGLSALREAAGEGVRVARVRDES